MTDIFLKILIISLVSVVFGELIEYYPSKSVFINTQIKPNKQNHHVKKRETKMRHFNEQTTKSNKTTNKRATDPVFHGYPKTKEELWNERFLNKSSAFDQTPSLIKLLHNITVTYLNDCTPVILYDSQVKSKASYLFQNLLKGFPVTFVHGYINDSKQLEEPKLLNNVHECLHYIVFLTDVRVSAKILGKQSYSKVVIVARSSQWTVQEFLVSKLSRMFVNLLVIAQSFTDDHETTIEAPNILYTHKLYTDGLGASQPVVINSWSHGKFSREVKLFPPKMTHGYAGHRFVVSAAHKPPYVIRRVQTDKDGGNPRVVWDGVEIRLLRLLAGRNNFSLEIIEPKELHLGPGEAVANEIEKGRADIGVAGIYLTSERIRDTDVTFAHSQDCAVFITLASTALPRYRAILGPFHWHVWVALTFTYLIGIFPLAFSDKHTLRHLLHNSGEIENMFWYVFGTFTNCFTFVGKNSWSKTDKITTRLLIGWYWLFTIIITSCYTGSIIAFVTLPIFPQTVDTIDQLLSGFYRIGTLDRGGWERWFFNSSDPLTNHLLKKIEFVENVEAGIRNTTKAFFWPYAFLGSRDELQFIVQSNYTVTKSKRSVLHISNECFVPFGVSMIFPASSVYTAKLSSDLRRMLQSGIIDKIVDEVRFQVQRSSTGMLLAAGRGTFTILSAEEKGLTLADTQGMFLLLAAGFLIAATALISEWMGGFSKYCRLKRKNGKLSNADSQQDLITGSISSAESRNTIEGHIINVTKESIVIHDEFDTDNWDCRRSSSVDIDKEVRAIFEKDEQRRRIVSNDVGVINDDEVNSVSGEVFGDHLGRTDQ